MITTCCDLKTWFLRTTFNSKCYSNYKDLLGNFYYINANLSDDLKNYILSKNGSYGSFGTQYAGAVLSVYDQDGIISYSLLVYLIGKGFANCKNYTIGYITADLKNIDLDWQKYINSSNSININIPSNDLVEKVKVLNEIAQGFKSGNTYYTTKCNINRFFIPILNLNLTNTTSVTDILEEKHRVRNLVSIFQDRGFLSDPNSAEYFYVSRTPSICLLADSICKIAKSIPDFIKPYEKLENDNKNYNKNNHLN